MIKKKCIVCDKEFETTAKHALYCSDRCLKDALNKRLREKRVENKQDVYTLICQCCGKEFNAKKRQTKYCSKICKYEVERVRKKSQRGSTRHKKIIIEADIYSTWLVNFERLKPNDMLTRKAMIAKALGKTYGQLQSTGDIELRKLEKEAIRIMKREAKECAKRRKQENGV